jgi:hypothetical protein
MVITLWDVYSPRKSVPVGGTAFFMFGKNRYKEDRKKKDRKKKR